jgi:tetratricopeptide (TPR) repeat protein
MGVGAGRRAIRVLQRGLPWGCVAAALLVLAGCAGLPPQPPVSADDLTWAAGGAGMLKANLGVVPQNPADLLRVNDAMRRYAQSVAGGDYDVERRTAILAEALSDPDGLNMKYDAEATLGAEDAFRQRRANCLAFTMLYVALAREMGIPAVFNQVEIPPVWDIGDDTTSLLYTHVNARIERTSAHYQMVDVSGEEYSATYFQYPILDTAAEAQYYNNRAVELRLAKRNDESLQYQVRALQLAPDMAYLWTNLASLYLLEGNLRAARIAVTRALALDPSSRLGYDVAAQVYQRTGETRLAEYFRGRAQYFLEQNPYYHYQLALASWRDDDLPLAYDEVHRAILLERGDARFFFLLSAVLERLGKTQLANDSLAIALQMTPDVAQQQRYRSKFERLAKRG